MSMESNIEDRIYERTGRRIKVTKGMGFPNLRKALGKSVDLTKQKHTELNIKMKRWIASDEDLKDPENYYLLEKDKVTPAITVGTVVLDDNKPAPTESVLKFKTKEQQEDLSGMCVVSTARDLMEHSPNSRLAMFVHIDNVENFSPTINNYYQNAEQK